MDRFLEYFALSGLGVCAALLTGIYLWRLSGRARIYARRYGIIGLLAAAFFGFAAITEGPPDEDYKDEMQEELDGEGETNAVYGAMLCYSPRRALSAPSPAPTTEMDLSPRLVYVVTNEVYDYTMPTNAVEYASWRLRGAAEDWTRIEVGRMKEEGGSDWWRFPMGTNEYSAFRAFTDGTIRPKLHSLKDTISAVGTAMSAIPDLSRFWYSVGTNDSRILTWENFVAGRITNQVSSALPPSSFILPPLPSVSAQIELFPSGDYIVRSNHVERLYHRVNPDDWDDDGWQNDDDWRPYEWDGDNFGPNQWLPYDANTNAYYWIDLVADMSSLVTFTGEGVSNLEDPCFIARAGATNRVMLLIGKTYHATSVSPLTIIGRSDSAVEISNVTRKSFDVIWPVTFDIHEGRAPSPRPRLGATWNDGGKTFCIIPTPDFLNGWVEWTNDVCCSIWNSGFNYTYACDNTCQCSGCLVYGNYCYEGFSLPVYGIPCGCRVIEDQGEAEIVEFGFTKAAVFYEDPYTNMPGVVVSPQSSNSVLRCVVRGGTYGGTLTVSFDDGASKIVRVAGPMLPNGASIAAGTERTFEIEYKPVAPSDVLEDIVARAVYVEDFTGTRHEQTASLTSIKVQLTAVYDAPENHNQSRHVYGVGEKVVIDCVPKSPNIELLVIKADTGDNTTVYDTFAGESAVQCCSPVTYTCPAAGTKPDVMLSCLGASYKQEMEVIEPQEIVTPNATGSGLFVPGQVGMGCLTTENYVAPMFVSFRGVYFFEVPCTNVVPPTGYFATSNYTGFTSHSYYAGAGDLHQISDGNYFFTDAAGHDGQYDNWSSGRLVWKIPIGWRRYRYEGEVAYVALGPDYEKYDNPNSRQLLVGGREDAYKQVYSINSDGTASVEKFGYRLIRSRWSIAGLIEEVESEEE